MVRRSQRQALIADDEKPNYQETAAPDIEPPEQSFSAQIARLSKTVEGTITDSSNDKNIADTIARIQHYIRHQDALKELSPAVRKKLIKGMKSTFTNRYNGRCTASEKKDYIARWVELAGILNELVRSRAEEWSMNIKINPLWLYEDAEVITLD